MRILEVNADDSRTRTPYPANPPSVAAFALGDFQFPTHSPVTSLTAVLRDVEVPRRGRYEFRLLTERTRSGWKRAKWGWVASHYIAVE